MPKTIYTERDIEELARSGTREMALTEDIYLTDIARERAEKLGIALRAVSPSGSAPPAPERSPALPGNLPASPEEVVGRVKAEVIAKLGPAIDPFNQDRIVRRVVSQLK